METNRKFKIAAFIMLVASAIMIALVWGNYPKVDDIEPVLWWWVTVETSVLTLYGAANVIQKGVIKNGAPQ
jgi:intracellular septation protein A